MYGKFHNRTIYKGDKDLYLCLIFFMRTHYNGRLVFFDKVI